MLKAAYFRCALLAVFSGSLLASGTRETWISSAPELASLHPGLNDAGVHDLLRKAGAQIDATFDDFVTASMAEEVLELRLDPDDLVWSSRKASFRYSIEMSFQEGRSGEPAKGDAQPGYMEILRYFITDNQNKIQCSPFGHITTDGREYEVVAFMPVSGEPASGFEGLLWLDAHDATIRRIVVKLSDAPTTTMDVIYNPVHFGRAQTAVWLPGIAAVSTKGSRRESLDIHRFSEGV